MSTWSGIRNKLENDYLCPALRGHIQYFAASYSKSADHEGRAAIRMDGVEVLRSNYYTYFENVWTKFHHLRSTTLKDHDSTKEAIDRAHAYALEQGTFDQKVFYEAFGIFDNQGEFWKEADGDQLLLRPGEETIWYYAHEQDKVKRLCNDMTELLEKKLARYLNEH